MRIYLEPSTLPSCHLGFSPKAQPCPWSQGNSSAAGHSSTAFQEQSLLLPTLSQRKDAYLDLTGRRVLVSDEKQIFSKYVLSTYVFSPDFGVS